MLTRFLAAAGALALTTGLALAQTTAPTAPTAPGTAPAATSDMKDMKEWQAAKLAKVSLADAITTAQQKDGNGRAIDADFEKADGKNPMHWAIKVVYPDGNWSSTASMPRPAHSTRARTSRSSATSPA